MVNAPKTKVFYQINEVCERLGLSLLDMSVLVSERRIKLCTAVAGLLVEDGRYETALDSEAVPIPDRRHRVRGLVDLLPDDAWFVLRQGSQTISWLAAEPDRYRRLVSTSDEDCGYTVICDEVGVRHGELARYAAEQVAFREPVFGHGTAGRGAQALYDWDAARLEAFRRIYFDGVPESFGALIRHVQAWFADKGGKVPDESTLKRRLRDIWAMFGSEAQQKMA